MYVPLIIFCFIQGFTEFIPVSSQAHLIVFNHFIPLEQVNLNIRELTIIAHFGSLLAIIIYYYKQCLGLVLSFRNFFHSYLDPQTVLLKNLIYSSIPIFIIGYLITDIITEDILKSIELIGWVTLTFGIILYLIDKSCLRIKNIENIPTQSALLIGVFQCLALIPGFSRSGAVLSIMRLLGYTRTDSVNYSNLLSIPAISGAMAYLLFKDITIFSNENTFNTLTITVLIVSFIFSLMFIHFLVVWVRKSSLSIFMWYRVIFGLVILGYSYIDLINISR